MLRKLSYVLLVFLTCFLLFTSDAFAYTVPGSGGGGSPGGGAVTPAPAPGSGTTEDPPEPVIIVPPYTTYLPKVTQLRNVNAMTADFEDVYYVPTLDTLPFDLKAFCSDIVINEDETHQFALVYDGYYDTAAQLVIEPTTSSQYAATAHTTKKVYSSHVNTLALQTIGYDLLLQDEFYTLTEIDDGAKVDINYYNTTVFEQHSSNESASDISYKTLNYQTVVMDLYKALGIFEYDIRLAYGKDEDFDPNTSPILEQLNVITTTDGNYGVDDSEANTYVAITRTRADLYWDRYIKELIMTGDTTDEDIATSIHTSVCKAQGSTITLGEFCSIARAMLNLYNEPVLTETERQKCIQLYSVDYPKSDFEDIEIYDSIMYLAAKGIIEPTGLDFDKNVTYEDIDSILGRIANPEARLTLKTPEFANPQLTRAGYAKAEVKILNGISDMTFEDNSTAGWYDYLIEKRNNNTYYALLNTNKIDVKELTKEEDGIKTTITNTEVKPQTISTIEATSNMQLYVNGSMVPAGSAYAYDGVKKIRDKYFYHFKINPSYAANGVRIGYNYETETPTSAEDLVPITLSDSKGGIYEFDDDDKGSGYQGSKTEFVRRSFDNAGFDESYLDSERASAKSKETAMAGNRTLITFYVDASLVTKEKLLAASADGLAWNNLMNNNGVLQAQKNIVICNSPYMEVFVFDSTAADNKVRFEVITDNPNAFRSSAFLREFSSGVTDSTSGETGYYRNSDGSLLVSAAYLKKIGMLTSLQELDNDAGYVLTLKDLGTNVTVFTKDSNNFVMVGDTIYGNLTGETLAVATDGDILLSYRVCLGWVNSYMVMAEPNADGSIYAVNYGECQVSNTEFKDTIEKVRTLYPSSILNTRWSEVSTRGGARSNVKGFNLSGSYALSPYLMVMADDNGYDYLFVYHFRDQTLWNKVGGEIKSVTVSDAADEEARGKFKNLTGIDLPKDNTYGLVYFPLNRDDNYTYLHYVKSTFHQTRAHDEYITYGWIWSPPDYSSNGIDDAVDDYINSVTQSNNSQSSTYNTSVFLPIVEYQGQYYDVNLNTVEDAPGNQKLPTRHFLGDQYNSSKYAVLSYDTSVEYKDPETLGLSTAVSEAKLFAAPVGMFSRLRATPETKALDATKGALYYGSAKVTKQSDKLTINGRPCSVNPEDTVSCSYYGTTAGSSVYVTTAVETALGIDIQAIEDSIAVAIEDPLALVDWGQYKFDRLMKNADAWSTIVLIFVLNILPRVALLLFFILMMLSAVHNVKPWRMFCKRVFDVYKLLTMGHISVDTVDTKKLFITSMVCMALFMMIMDGQLFNFIIWVCELFIALYQH